MSFIKDLRSLLIAVWLGAACFFSFAVAPGAFAVLPQRDLAGSVVNRTLLIINVAGIAVGIILLLLTFVKQPNARAWKLWTERVLLILLTAACAVGQFVIAFWMSSLRAQMGKPIDEVPLEDPLRMQFDQLHQYSVWALGGAMVTALILFFLFNRADSVVVIPAKKDPYDFSDLIH